MRSNFLTTSGTSRITNCEYAISAPAHRYCFPERFRSGLIEAAIPPPRLFRVCSFPERFRSGLIEATIARFLPYPLSVFRGGSARNRYPHLDPVFPMVIHQRDGLIGLFDAIDGDTHFPFPGGGLHHCNVVDRLPVAVVHLKALPVRGKTGRKPQFIDFKTQPQKRFHDQPVHPGGRSRVPGPAAAAGMRRYRIDIGRNDVGFHLVGGGLLRRSCHGSPG